MYSANIQINYGGRINYSVSLVERMAESMIEQMSKKEREELFCDMTKKFCSEMGEEGLQKIMEKVLFDMGPKDKHSLVEKFFMDMPMEEKELVIDSFFSNMSKEDKEKIINTILKDVQDVVARKNREKSGKGPGR